MKHLSFIVPLLLLSGLTATHAAVIYTSGQNIPIPFTFATSTYVNVDTNATSTSASDPVDFNTAPWVAFDLGGDDIYNSPSTQQFHPVVGAGNIVLNLALNTVVDSSSNYPVGFSASSAHTGPASGQFQNNVPGYFGFSFEKVPAGPTFYGWMKITVNTTGVGTGTIHEWAYENVPGASIPVGYTGVIIPEPGVMCLGAVGLMLFLRRRTVSSGC